MFFHPKPLVRIGYSIPVLMIFGIIGGIYYLFVRGYMLLTPVNFGTVLLYIFFNSLVVMLLWCFVRTVMTDPGTIPEGFSLDSI